MNSFYGILYMVREGIASHLYTYGRGGYARVWRATHGLVERCPYTSGTVHMKAVGLLCTVSNGIEMIR